MCGPNPANDNLEATAEFVQSDSYPTFQIACPIPRTTPPLQPRNRCGRFVKSVPEAERGVASKVEPFPF